MLFLVWSSFLKIKLNFLVNAFINLSILIISEGKEKSLESPIILQNTNFLHIHPPYNIRKLKMLMYFRMRATTQEQQAPT